MVPTPGSAGGLAVYLQVDHICDSIRQLKGEAAQSKAHRKSGRKEEEAFTCVGLADSGFFLDKDPPRYTSLQPGSSAAPVVRAARAMTRVAVI
eukprot:scaffold217_cov377-Prasinococcus_capsulatus_cf.AAC.32